ncbi:MAG TPA: DEAD/DEAH box helicase, partial [Enhygromyxa sp.]|nr:DEAD/DEAH box helicase [Enhygromyxa sp.]
MPTVPTLSISPRSSLRVSHTSTEGRAPPGLRDAFARGLGHGLLHLGGPLLNATLEPNLAFGRELARGFYSQLCRRDAVPPALPTDLVTRLLLTLPPMPGAEYATPTTFERAWAELLTASRAELDETGVELDAWLERKNPAWRALGRVYFHLAENKRDPEFPFAFVATYVDGLADWGEPLHRTLAHALDVFAGDRPALLRLLRPLEHAARNSPLVARLVEAGEIYHPVRWTPDEAFAFLQQIPDCEAAGVRVRVPDWWRGRARRVVARAQIGQRESAELGVDALLDFDASLVLGDAQLTAAEARALLEGTAGLRLVRGQWVSVDPERLREALDHFQRISSMAGAGELSFARAMRMLAGVDADTAAADADGALREIVAGSWLSRVLEELGDPDARREADPGKQLKATLRPYQSRGVAWMWLLWQLGLGGCLADDMGLGKTIQVLALVLVGKRRRYAGPHLVVVPASLLGNWAAEAQKFAPSLRLLVAHRSHAGAGKPVAELEAEAERTDIVLTTYGTLTRTDWLRERSWGLVVLDEAQAIKNAGTQQTRAAKQVRGRARLALTGTPVENRVDDLWSIFDFLNPGLLGSAGEFRNWTKTAKGFAPLRRLVSPYVLRRLKTDPRVAPDLPDKTEIVAYCGLSPKQAALYAEAVESLRHDLLNSTGIERRGLILAYLQRFKQICNHPSLWLGERSWTAEASGKFARLTEICEPLAERQERALVFTQFRSMTKPLCDYLATVFGEKGLVLDGRTPVRRRAELVEQFQRDDGPPYFVISLKAGGTGLNLTAASHVIHFDRWWNPAVENQATDRAYRIGQHRNVLVHKFVCRGTLEERIDAMLDTKRALADELLDVDGAATLTEMSNEQLMAVVQL